MPRNTCFVYVNKGADFCSEIIVLNATAPDQDQTQRLSFFFFFFFCKDPRKLGKLYSQNFHLLSAQ